MAVDSLSIFPVNITKTDNQKNGINWITKVLENTQLQDKLWCKILDVIKGIGKIVLLKNHENIPKITILLSMR